MPSYIIFHGTSICENVSEYSFSGFFTRKYAQKQDAAKHFLKSTQSRQQRQQKAQHKQQATEKARKTEWCEVENWETKNRQAYLVLLHCQNRWEPHSTVSAGRLHLHGDCHYHRTDAAGRENEEKKCDSSEWNTDNDYGFSWIWVQYLRIQKGTSGLSRQHRVPNTSDDDSSQSVYD